MPATKKRKEGFIEFEVLHRVHARQIDFHFHLRADQSQGTLIEEEKLIPSCLQSVIVMWNDSWAVFGKNSPAKPAWSQRHRQKAAHWSASRGGKRSRRCKSCWLADPKPGFLSTLKGDLRHFISRTMLFFKRSSCSDHCNSFHRCELCCTLPTFHLSQLHSSPHWVLIAKRITIITIGGIICCAACLLFITLACSSPCWRALLPLQGAERTTEI